MKILITGAGGFIGRELVERLRHDSNEIIAILRNDNNFFGQNIEKVFVDLSDDNFVEKLPSNIDCIVHLAQSEFYREFPEKATQIFDINVGATLKLLDWGLKNKIKKFIYFSSGNVYKPQNKLLEENDELQGVSFYGSSKMMAEELCKNYKDFFEVIIVRPFGVYGPNQTGMLIQNIHKRLLNNESIYLASGSGLNISLIYIDDCIDLAVGLVKKQLTKSLSIFNIAGNEILDLKQIAEGIGNIVGIVPNYVFENKEPMYLMASNKKIVETLNITPKITFNEGIKKCFNVG